MPSANPASSFTNLQKFHPGYARRRCSMKDLNPTVYVVRRKADRWVFVPSPTFTALMVGGFGAGSAFLIYLSTIFFRRTGAASANLWCDDAILLLVAGLSAAVGIRAWPTRCTPLNIEFGGRVSYGERELCAAGTVRAARIAPSRGSEAGDCDVVLELARKMVSIPSQYFAVFNARAHARPFAAKLAEALGVKVTESD
jgi:hypothetical protein